MYESIALCEQTRNRWGMGTAHRFLGLALAEEGQFAEAKNEFQKSLEIFSDYTEGWDIARTLTYLGDVTQHMGDLKEARTFYLNALPLAIQVQAIPIVLDALVGLAQLAVQTENFVEAYELSSFVLHHLASTEESKDRARMLLHRVESCLTTEQMEMLQAKVNTHSLESMVDQLLLNRQSPARLTFHASDQGPGL
jgi:tetratricopeptide (TPR) repeat protein